MTDSEIASAILQTERTIDASPVEIYAAFADGARLARWWGPAGFTNTFEIFEFRPGGSWKFVMHGPNGADYANESIFDELIPGQKVVIRHIALPHFTLAVSLQPVPGGTRVEWVQEFENPTVAAEVRKYAGAGNEQNLDRLQAHLRGAL
jgi:uncharacterized protein YndB with AHSA1/START domain